MHVQMSLKSSGLDTEHAADFFCVFWFGFAATILFKHTFSRDYVLCYSRGEGQLFFLPLPWHLFFSRRSPDMEFAHVQSRNKLTSFFLLSLIFF